MTRTTLSLTFYGRDDRPGLTYITERMFPSLGESVQRGWLSWVMSYWRSKRRLLIRKGACDTMARSKRMIAWALSLALLVMSFPLSLHVEAAFTDVAGNWAKDSIEALADRGIIGGYPDHTFRPDAPVTRGEFASLLATAFPIPAAGEVMFPDIGNHWASGAIRALTSAGYFEGYTDGQFRPNQSITRAESAAVLTRALGLGDVDGFAMNRVATFSDVPASHWAANHVEIAAHL